MTILSYLIKLPILKRLIPGTSLKFLKLLNKNRGFFKIKNLKMYLDFLDPIDRQIILLQKYEDKEINFLINNLKLFNIKYFIDIGSNCGYYSLFVTNNNTQIKTIAFEPNQEAYYKFSKSLQENLHLSSRIKLYNFGLSNKNSKLQMKSLIKYGYAQTGGSSVDKQYKKNTYEISLEKFYIGDKILKFNNKFLAIKIDVEGHELKVLQGFEKLIKKNKCIIQVEIFRENFDLVNNFLEKKRFKIFKKIKLNSNFFYKNFN